MNLVFLMAQEEECYQSDDNKTDDRWHQKHHEGSFLELARGCS
jgi:hypothetical protein